MVDALSPQHHQHSTISVLKRSIVWQVKKARTLTNTFLLYLFLPVMCFIQLHLPRFLSYVSPTFTAISTMGLCMLEEHLIPVSAAVQHSCHLYTVSVVFLSVLFLSLVAGGKTALFIYIFPFIRSFYLSHRNPFIFVLIT